MRVKLGFFALRLEETLFSCRAKYNTLGPVLAVVDRVL